jgi:lipopolysaccharide export system protein LptA
MMRREFPRQSLFVLAAVAALCAPLPALAQAPAQGPPNALQGFSQNRDKPVHIEAAALEVRDKDKVATFSGNVRVTQGDTGLRCKSLLVFYEQDASKDTGMKAANPGPGGNQQIKRLEMKGGVVVTQKDQTVTGDTGVFDMRSNTVTMVGNVVMSQGQNVLRGERLIVDLTTGTSRVEAGKPGQGGRVQGLFHSGGPAPGKSDTGLSGLPQMTPPMGATRPAAPAAAPYVPPQASPQPAPRAPSGIY